MMFADVCAAIYGTDEWTLFISVNYSTIYFRSCLREGGRGERTAERDRIDKNVLVSLRLVRWFSEAVSKRPVGVYEVLCCVFAIFSPSKTQETKHLTYVPSARVRVRIDFCFVFLSCCITYLVGINSIIVPDPPRPN